MSQLRPPSSGAGQAPENGNNTTASNTYAAATHLLQDIILPADRGGGLAQIAQ